MSIIEAIGSERRDALRTLAARIGASDDTATMAWVAWQTFAGMPSADRVKAIGILLALEEIKRAADGDKPMFTVPA